MSKKEIFDNCEIYHGNCYEIMSTITTKIDLIVTDPPYHFESKGGGFYGDWHGKGHESRKYLDQLDNLDCTEFNVNPFLKIITEKITPFQGYFFCNKKLILPYLQYAEENGYMYDVLALHKTNPIPACNSHHLHDLEYIIMIRENGSKYYKHPNFKENSKLFTTQCKPNNIHPAQKPLELNKRLIQSLSKPGDVIIDPFLGSGQCALASLQLNRKFIGIEISQKYFDISCKQIETYLNNSLKDFF